MGWSNNIKKFTEYSISTLLAIIILVVSLPWRTLAATSVDLDTANSFAVLGGSTVTNTGYSIINGDLGLSPGTSVTGFPPGTVSGTIYASDGDGVASSAKASLTTAYNDATDQSCDTDLTGQDLGGLILTPGVYCFSTSAQLTGTLTLDAQGDSSAVFIFKTESTLVTANNSRVNLINSAQSCNVFWRIGSSATLESSTIFTGNIIALTSITLNTSATVDGRVLARDGAVTLDSNIITAAVCAAPLINIVKVPNPLSLPDGPGSVTYNYTVTNTGVVAMSNITVTDDTCSPVSYISGDTDADNRLDTTETWSYSCIMVLSATTTNTVTATGLANGFTATDTANATVVVGSAIVPPLINIVKTPNILIASYGETVIYTYNVNNPGTVALNDVSVTDNKCAPLSSPSGDSNTNNLLDVSETWVYTCQTTLTVTTTNTATAIGSANSLTATDTSTATVVVAPATISIAAIEGLTAPVTGAAPVTTITQTAQYTGAVTWLPVDSTFASTTAYTAYITLTPKTGYTCTGVGVDFFTVAGTSSPATNLPNTCLITAVFPATAPSVMTGTVNITGTVEYGATLTANITGLIYTPTTGADVPTYQWYRGEDAVGTNSANYTLVQADIGSTITVIVTADGVNATGLVSSDPTTVVTQAQLTIAAPTVTTTKPYDGDASVAVCTSGELSGIVGSEAVTATCVATYANATVGTGKTITVVYTLSGIDAAKYIKPVDYTVATGIITAKSVTVTTDADQTKVYGATDPTFTYTVALALIGSDTFTGALDRAAGTTVGTYAIGQGTLSAGTNYDITFVPDNFSITAVQLVPHITANNKEYDGGITTTLSDQSVTGMVNGETDVTLIVGVKSFNDANVGTRTVTASTLSLGGTNASNYALAIGATVTDTTVDITAKPITVTANASQTKIYGATDPTFTYTVAPALIGSDTFTGTLDRAAGTTVGTYAIGQGTLSAGTNYDITFVPANFSITAKPLTTSGTEISLTKPYDGNATVATCTPGALTGIVGVENVTTTCVATYADAAVGTGKTVNVVYTLGGADLANYIKPVDGSTTADIMVVTINIAAIPGVTAPKLPNAGISLRQNVGLGIVVVGIITVLFSLYFVRKRLKN